MFSGRQLAAKPSQKVMIEPTPQYPDIILALTLIETTPPKFHWLIFVPDITQRQEQIQSGHKLHATEQFVDPEVPWCFEAARFTLATSRSVAAAAVIGQLKNKTFESLRDLLAVIPMSVPEADMHREPEFRCRVWIREALRRMHTAGYIYCPDVNAMEAEMWVYGKSAAAAVEDNSFKLARLVTAVNSRTL